MRLGVLWRRLYARRTVPQKRGPPPTLSDLEIKGNLMLTDFALRAAHLRKKPYKLFDEHGLFLFITPAGTRVWRMKYRYRGTEKLLVIGRYPEVSLKAARAQRDAARDCLAAGIDPGVARRERADARATPVPPERTFEAVAREWSADRKKSERWEEGYAAQVLSQLERDVFPIRLTRGLSVEERSSHPLLSRPVGTWSLEALTPPDVLEICRNVEARGSLDAARDLRSRISMVYQREKVLGRCTANPAENVTALLAKPQRTNHAAITYSQLPEFFVRLDAEALDPTTRFGIEGILATWLRSSELRLALWSWIDWDVRELRIPSASMKNGDRGKGDHIVPLSDYATAVFHGLYAFSGRQELMFPSLKHSDESISDGAWLNALYRMGYKDKATVHGMRALGSTTANESYVTVVHVPVPVKMWESRWIDRQLDHVDKSVSGVYNRAEYLEPRRALMQWWGRKLQEARAVALNIGRPSAGLQESPRGSTSFTGAPASKLAAP
jgi:integrase